MKPLFLLIIGGAVGYLARHFQNKSDMALNKKSLLQALALVAAAQALALDARKENAALKNKVAVFQEEHDLVNDAEVNTALSAVLRAAETAPPSADATHAANVTAKFLDVDGDGKDDATGKTAAELDAENAANGASGNSGLPKPPAAPAGNSGPDKGEGAGGTTGGESQAGPTGDPGAQGDEGPAGDATAANGASGTDETSTGTGTGTPSPAPGSAQ